MLGKKSNGAIAAMLLLAVFGWGGSNAGTKYLIMIGWPPVMVGCTRLLFAGWLLLGILRWTNWLGRLNPVSTRVDRELWWKGGLILAIYIVLFNSAMMFIPASHMALYLGASPVWALIWEERPAWTWKSAQRYGAAGLAMSGVLTLNLPAFRSGASDWRGEVLGLVASLFWTAYGRQARALSETITGVEVGAHTMWRAGLILLPLAIIEVLIKGMVVKPQFVLVQTFCIISGGVLAYALWNSGLQHWPTSKVFLFNNLIPVSTMTWAWFCLGEPVTHTFWLAMVLIVVGVILGQGKWDKILGARWMPMD